MRERLIELIGPMRSIGLESVLDAFLWLVLTAVGGLMPLWAGYFVLRAFSQNIGPFTFAGNGEFALYSAAILSTAVFEVSKELGGNAAQLIRTKKKAEGVSHLIRITFPYHRGINALSIALIGIAATAFATVTTARIPGAGLALDQGFVHSVTIALFVASVVIGILVTALGRPFISQLELKEREDAGISRLGQDFDALKEGR